MSSFAHVRTRLDIIDKYCQLIMITLSCNLRFFAIIGNVFRSRGNFCRIYSIPILSISSEKKEIQIFKYGGVFFIETNMCLKGILYGSYR